MTLVAGGRFPTQSACPDCFGLRGGPLGNDGIGETSEGPLRNGMDGATKLSVTNSEGRSTIHERNAGANSELPYAWADVAKTLGSTGEY